MGNATYFFADSQQWFQNHAIHDDSMQKWQRSMELQNQDGSPNDKLNIGGYRNAKDV